MRQLAVQFCEQGEIAHYELRAHIGDHAGREFGRAVSIQRYSQHAAQHHSIKRRDPLGAVFGPQHYAIAEANPSLLEQSRETSGEMPDLGIGCDASAHTLKTDDSDVVIVSPKLVEQCGKVRTHVFLRHPNSVRTMTSVRPTMQPLGERSS